MQGSRIAHAVTPVTRASEPRITVVNSYQSLNPFSSDRTIYVGFRDMEPTMAALDFARHVAWRARGQLEYLMNEGQLYGRDDDIAKILGDAAAELARASGLISRRIVDSRPYKPLEGEEEEEKSQQVGKRARM